MSPGSRWRSSPPPICSHISPRTTSACTLERMAVVVQHVPGAQLRSTTSSKPCARARASNSGKVTVVMTASSRQIFHRFAPSDSAAASVAGLPTRRRHVNATAVIAGRPRDDRCRAPCAPEPFEEPAGHGRRNPRVPRAGRLARRRNQPHSVPRLHRPRAAPARSWNASSIAGTGATSAWRRRFPSRATSGARWSASAR